MGTEKDHTSQADRFAQAARDVGADEADDALDRVMGKLDLKKRSDDAHVSHKDQASSETES